MPDSDDNTARQFVAHYAQDVLNSTSPAVLLFHVSDFGAAAFSHRIPEEMVILTPQHFALIAVLHKQYALYRSHTL